VKKRLDENGEPVEGMNVPLSLGPVHKETDKSGTECAAYDIIVHPKVIQDAKEDATGTQRDFLCHLGMQAIEQKHPERGTLDRRYKLPKLKYLGDTVQSQYIRDRKNAPTIQEISESKSSSSSSSATQTNTAAAKANAKKSTTTVTPVVEPDKELPYRLIWLKTHPNENSSDIDSSSSSSGSTSILPPNTYEGKPLGNDSGSEYIEPLLVPEEDVFGVALLADFGGVWAAAANPKDVNLKLSPFKLEVSIYSEYIFESFHSVK
jgi:PIH1 N-terminal domain